MTTNWQEAKAMALTMDAIGQKYKRRQEQRLVQLAAEILRDRLFMEDCEANKNSSYHGDNQAAVRRADQAAMDAKLVEYRAIRRQGYSPKQHKAIII